MPEGRPRIESDGWYIDLKYGVDCPASYRGMTSAAYRRGGCNDEIRMRSAGVANPGFPVLITTKSFNDDGSFSTMTREVVELSRSPLDAALFDVPAGYSEAKDDAQRAGADAANGNAGEDEDGGAKVSPTQTGGNNPGGANGSNGASASARQAALGPKRAGVVRIGVVMPSTQMAQGASGIDVATPVRNMLVQRLSGSSVEITPLEARVPREVELEARQKECDYVLYTGVAQKKGGGGGFGGFLKKAIPVVDPASSMSAGSGSSGDGTGARRAPSRRRTKSPSSSGFCPAGAARRRRSRTPSRPRPNTTARMCSRPSSNRSRTPS